MNILLFAGTTEGRLLSGKLSTLPVRRTTCVATEYGKELLGENANCPPARAGRLTAAEMLALMRAEKTTCVIDATHPYAAAARANIRAAADAAGVPLLRLARGASCPAPGAEHFADAAAAALALAGTTGNVLLTTGVKTLAAFTAVPGYAARIHPRVLPSEESLRVCAELGFARARTIAMQGPFSRELNRALLRQFAIRILVTKDGGAEGGFPEKILAAEDTDARVFVIDRPREEENAKEDAAQELNADGILAAVAAMLAAQEETS